MLNGMDESALEGANEQKSSTVQPSTEIKAIERPRPVTPSSTSHEGTLQSLPNELWIEIATALTPVDRTCLAFTSRRAYQVMGRALRVRLWPERYRLLCRLELDGVWLEEILCGPCEKFHRPRKNRAWGTREGARACIQQGDALALSCLQSPYLPDQVHFDIVAAITRSNRFKSGVYDVGCLASKHEYNDGDAKIIRNVSARLYGGELFLKTELILSAGPACLENIPKLVGLLRQHIDLGNICQHTRWDEIWPFVFYTHFSVAQNASQHYFGERFCWECDISSQELQKCLWTHGEACWTHCDASSGLQPQLEPPWACSMCATDYWISCVRRKGHYSRENFVIFTSWKNLGSGDSLHNPQWREHMEGLNHGYRITKFNSTAESFEGPEKHDFSWLTAR